MSGSSKVLLLVLAVAIFAGLWWALSPDPEVAPNLRGAKHPATTGGSGDPAEESRPPEMVRQDLPEPSLHVTTRWSDRKAAGGVSVFDLAGSPLMGNMLGTTDAQGRLLLEVEPGGASFEHASLSGRLDFCGAYPHPDRPSGELTLSDAAFVELVFEEPAAKALVRCRTRWESTFGDWLSFKPTQAFCVPLNADVEVALLDDGERIVAAGAARVEGVELRGRMKLPVASEGWAEIAVEVTHQGVPVEGCVIELGADPNRWTSSTKATARLTAATDGTGRARLILPRRATRCVLRASKAGFVSALHHATLVASASGGLWRCELERAGALIVERAANWEGPPVRLRHYVQVMSHVSRPYGEVLPYRGDEVRFAHVPPGQVSRLVVLNRDGRELEVIQIEPVEPGAARRVNLQTQGVGVITVLGGVLAGGRIRIRRLGESFSGSDLRADHARQSVVLPGGKYTVTLFDAFGEAAASQQVELASGGMAEVLLSLDLSGSCTVKSNTGRVLPDFPVIIKASGKTVRTKSDKRGVVAWHGRGPVSVASALGGVALTVDHGGGAPSVLAVPLSPGELESRSYRGPVSIYSRGHVAGVVRPEWMISQWIDSDRTPLQLPDGKVTVTRAGGLALGQGQWSEGGAIPLVGVRGARLALFGEAVQPGATLVLTRPDRPETVWRMTQAGAFVSPGNLPEAQYRVEIVRDGAALWSRDVDLVAPETLIECR